ncbi:MAG: AAA family ATPase, partial [Spirochaetes bacterium]|nr:AAA family ATPase [Candidatus Ornithospirochaeta stercoripullorum]
MEKRIKLPSGRTDFRKIREYCNYYVDKTGNISKLIRDDSDAILFTRPRRFGKTTFQSMLRAFFDIREDSRDIFSGLAIMNDEEAVENWMNRYPVIYLTFKDVDGLSFSSAVSKLRTQILEFFQSYAFLPDKGIPDGDEPAFRSILKNTASVDEISQSLRLLVKLLYNYYGKKAIILIDEYDVPLDKAEK